MPLKGKEGYFTWLPLHSCTRILDP